MSPFYFSGKLPEIGLFQQLLLASSLLRQLKELFCEKTREKIAHL
jgi:hypothetical protein